jgi:hypothetical protein
LITITAEETKISFYICSLIARIVAQIQGQKMGGNSYCPLKVAQVQGQKMRGNSTVSRKPQANLARKKK